MKNSPYQTTASRIPWSCPWYRVRQDDIITPDGRSGVYNVIESPPSVWIVPVTVDGRLVLIRNYRYTVDAWCWEVPAGSIEPGRDVLATAAAELREEVGGVAATFQQIGRFFTAPGICNEDGHYFLATGVQLTAVPQRESTEVMEIHLTPIAEALAMVRRGDVTDGNTALALLAAEPYLRELL